VLIIQLTKAKLKEIARLAEKSLKYIPQELNMVKENFAVKNA
jgi:hypothetical protein